MTGCSIEYKNAMYDETKCAKVMDFCGMRVDSNGSVRIYTLSFNVMNNN